MINLDSNGFVELPPAYVKVNGALVTNPAVRAAQQAAYYQYRTAYRQDGNLSRAVGRYRIDGSVNLFVRTLK